MCFFLTVDNMFHTQISWSGCKDSQTSADTQEAGSATGAMSFVSLFERFIQLCIRFLILIISEQAFTSVLSKL